MTKLGIVEDVQKHTRRAQFVFEAKWQITVDNKEEVVTQLVGAQDFQRAFFKTRTWAKENCVGELVSIVRRSDVVI